MAYRRKNFEADCRFTHPFQIFHGNKQRRDGGDAGSLGQKKGNYTDWNRRYDTSALEAGIKRKADSGGAGPLPAERRVCSPRGLAVSGK